MDRMQEDQGIAKVVDRLADRFPPSVRGGARSRGPANVERRNPSRTLCVPVGNTIRTAPAFMLAIRAGAGGYRATRRAFATSAEHRTR
jgi:hypothetical protein